jgi:hypothetical protein
MPKKSNTMDISLWSILLFVLTTVVYFTYPKYGKPHLLVGTSAEDYKSASYRRMGAFLAVTLFIQLVLNAAYVSSKCGSGAALGRNIGLAMLYTIVPWLLIFGIVMLVLSMYPGFKKAFSDVVGYYAVAGSANTLFSQLLVSSDIKTAIDTAGNDATAKRNMTKAAEAIMKICGNRSVLLNQMTTENFEHVWSRLQPLMTADGNTPGNKQALLDLVAKRENIGEAMWYVYTAILISSVVYYNLAATGCSQDVNDMKASHDKYVEQQTAATAKTELEDKTQYTMG